MGEVLVRDLDASVVKHRVYQLRAQPGVDALCEEGESSEPGRQRKKA